MTRFFKPKFFSNHYFFLVFLILFLVGWNVFFNARFIDRRNAHQDKLERLVAQAREAHYLISSDDVLKPHEMFSKLSQPTIQILEELGSWDEWMVEWVEFWMKISLFITIAISFLLCTRFAPKKRNGDKDNSSDSRTYLSNTMVRLVIIVPLYFLNLLLISKPAPSSAWSFKLGEVARDWSFEYLFKEADYSAWTRFFVNIWPESLIQAFSDKFNLWVFSSFSLLQFSIFIIFILPFIFQFESGSLGPIEIPMDKLQPGERVLRFPEETERKTVDRWM